jgi:hypothetical protein
LILDNGVEEYILDLNDADADADADADVIFKIVGQSNHNLERKVLTFSNFTVN